MINEITVTKARVHNLKDVTIKIPKNTLTVITGPSGSGKSSLAFDTIYVEGQRRYIESLSSYARQFLGQHQPPDVESLTGLSPSIAIDQKTSSKNPRSTVGTTTEIFDYLRVLYARVGTLYCPISGKEIKKHSPTQISKELSKLPLKTKVQIVAPILIENKSHLKGEIGKFLTMGFLRARIDNEIIMLDENTHLEHSDAGQLDIIIDRIVIKEGIAKRLADSVEYALKLGQGKILALVGEGKKNKELLFSEKNISPDTGEVYPDLEPRLFSFNSPLGACPHCNGLGESRTFDVKVMVLDDSLSILDGAIGPLSKKNSFMYKMVQCMAEQEGIDINKPLKKLPASFREKLYAGSKKSYTYSFESENSNFEFSKPFPGLVKWLDKKFHNTGSERVRKRLEKYMNIVTCPYCKGERLNETALNTLIDKKNIMDICHYSIQNCHDLFKSIKLTGDKKLIAEKLLKEIKSRLKFLVDVGLGYLSLNRPAMTLSGGESQRIRLATQIGSALCGVLYVLDEPSIGLHQRDNAKLIKTMKSLRDLGNTVLVVEHDEETMREADYLIDMGPGAGTHGGRVVAAGKPAQFLKEKKSLTARYLSNKESIETPKERRLLSDFIKLRGATQNNLKKVDVDIPLSMLICLSGVSGSGKSTMVHEILVPAIRAYLTRSDKILYQRGNYNSISGVDKLKSVIELDQSPIGRTPNSNPATYTGLFDAIRTLYSQTPESQIRGYKPGRFSFNVKGGRCEECEGNGVKKIEMHFLPDVFITCSECHGSRFNNETLSVLYKSKHISDILNMTIEEAGEFFKNHPKMNRILTTLNDVGLGYMKLGQPAATLSGGEAQRLKLSRELAKRVKGHCFYVLDEPTTGLHFQDIKILIKAIQKLVDQGHTVLVIEHNIDVIKSCDYVIDLGPEGGDGGGEIVATGTPEAIAKVKVSHTGKYLKNALKKK
ncbi:MAG: excinuclease ABC subunit UvrA [Halobacteriovoraceae bacterium]|nr:excinuclease ABC subunit UvrA [Halobacteriovoraceae bacterium]